MPRLSFSTRIGLIVVASVALVWLGGVALSYASQSRGDGAALPLPAQIAAIVDLVERTPRERQRSVLDAVTSDRLLARLEDGDGSACRHRVRWSVSGGARWRSISPNSAVGR